MSTDYFAIVDGPDGLDANFVAQTEAILRPLGIRRHDVHPTSALFMTHNTPSLSIQGMGTILGHVFSQTGRAIVAASQFPRLQSPAQFRQHLIRHCWGPYLLFQPADGEEGLTVMREPSPSGDMPCFYSIEKGRGFITSDISLAELLGLYRRRIDWDAIHHRLSFPQVKSARTTLACIRELLPGCTLHQKGDNTSVRSAWSPWDFVATDQRHVDPQEAARDIRTAVMSSVQALASNDKSLLLELSGGLDSSIVGACLPGSAARVACTSLTTEVPGADEHRYATQIADQLGVKLHAEILHLEDALFDFPIHPRCLVPRIGVLQNAVDEIMLAAAGRHGVHSFFSGGGGDTVFCSLDTAAPAADAFRECGIRGGFGAVRNLAALHQCTLWKAARLALRKLRTPSGISRLPDGSFLEGRLATPLCEAHPWDATPPDSMAGDRERIRGLATCQAYRDSLARGTQKPMRMPLLSQPVVEACLRTPTWMWISEGRNRAVARAAFADLLPPDIRNRRSKGTFMSYLGAVYQRNRNRIREFLLEGRLQERGLLDAEALDSFLRRDLPERGHPFMRVFDICMVENWVRHQR
ncbi:asparagine synthase [Stenotrophomonas sp. MYb238]|uniref:asparagine synthase-related protein n=1 Tax=Stenotrophomonas sp. MYb238 TaxID=2040281 RepID=UPI001290BD26|nr:asparagine synthase-related protein [Stenotrophomonas sp. MYb238]MQP74294.1 asparagine synthase [Stenotrophomonas sp. MYb238]